MISKSFGFPTEANSMSSEDSMSSFIDDIEIERDFLLPWDEQFERMYAKLLENINTQEINQKTKLMQLCAVETNILREKYEQYQKMPSESYRKALVATSISKFKKLADQIIQFMYRACPRKPTQLITFENPIELDGNKTVNVIWLASGRVKTTWPITYPLEYKDLVELELVISMQWFEPLLSPSNKEVNPYRPLWDSLNSFINALEKLMPDNNLPPRMHYRN